MNRTLLRKTWRELRVHRTQSLALILIVALGISSTIALVGAYRDLDTSYEYTYDQLGFADVVFRVEGAPEAVLANLRRAPGVAAATGRLIVDSGYVLPDGEPIRSRLIGQPAGDLPAVNRLQIVEGRYLEGGDRTAAVIDSHFAAIHDLHPGDTVTPIVNGEPLDLTVVGVGTSPEYLIVSPSAQEMLPSARTFAVLFLPRAALQALTGNDGVVNDVAVRFKPGVDPEATVAALQEQLAAYGLRSTTWQSEIPSHAALQQDLAGYQEIAYLMPGLILVVAVLSVYVMLGRMVTAQQPQIGLMKALGYSRRAILSHYLLFGLLISLIGAVLGIIGGIPMGQAITTAYAHELGIPLVETRFYPDLILASALLSVVLSVLAGIGPARHSARLAPAEAMRLDPAIATNSGGVTLLERLVPLPLWWRLPLRTVTKLRRRSITTVAGIIFAFILVLMVWGLFDSMRYFVDHFLNEVEQWDVMVVFDEPQTGATLQTIREMDGVDAVEPALQMPATLRVNGIDEDVLLVGVEPDQAFHRLQLVGGGNASEALAVGKLVLSQGLAEQLDVAAGDTVSVDTPFGKQEVEVGGLSKEFINAIAYTRLEDMQALLPLQVPVFNSIYVTAGKADQIGLKAAMYRLPGVASVELQEEQREAIESLLGLFYVLMGVMFAFAVAMAAALIFNAMTINVLERQRELATMRAIGTGSARVAYLITAENIILWLIALLPGLVAGYWVAQQMGAAFSAELFRFDVVIQPASYVVTAVSILATMLLASIPAVRRVNRLDLATSTKVLS